MTQAKGRAARISYVTETTRGTTPASPSMKQLMAAVYGESLSPKIGSITSKAIKSTRGRGTTRGGEIRIDGSVPFELSTLGIANLLYHALGSKSVTGSGPYTHVIKRGALPVGLSIEKGFTDLAQYWVHKGCLINGFNLNISPEDAFVTGAFDFIGMGYAQSGTSLGTPSTVVHAPFTEWEVAAEEGGSGVTLLNFSLNYQNDIERVAAIGTRYAAGLNEGEGMVDFNTTVMFESMDLANKWLNETATTMQVTATSGASSVAFLLPRAKYFGDSAPKIATDKGVVVELAGMCEYDSTEATDIKITVVNTETTLS